MSYFSERLHPTTRTTLVISAFSCESSCDADLKIFVSFFLKKNLEFINSTVSIHTATQPQPAANRSILTRTSLTLSLVKIMVRPQRTPTKKNQKTNNSDPNQGTHQHGQQATMAAKDNEMSKRRISPMESCKDKMSKVDSESETNSINHEIEGTPMDTRAGGPQDLAAEGIADAIGTQLAINPQAQPGRAEPSEALGRDSE